LAQAPPHSAARAFAGGDMAASPTSRWEERLQGVNAWLADSAHVRRMADRCGVQPWVVAGAAVLWLACFILWGFTGELICTVVGSLYPMYASFKALEDADHAGVSQWLVYWVTYSAVMLGEGLLYRALCWIPFYHIIRLLFVVWLFLPMAGGAQSMYAWAVGPLLRRYRPAIDGALARSAEEVCGTLAGQRNEELRQAFRSAAAAARRPRGGDRGSPAGVGGGASKDLGIEDLVARELAREAALGLSKVAVAGAAALLQHGAPAAPLEGAAPPPPASLGAKHRSASPRPACLAPLQPVGQVPAEQAVS